MSKLFIAAASVIILIQSAMPGTVYAAVVDVGFGIKFDPASPKAAEEEMPGVNPEVTPSKNMSATGNWVFAGDDSDYYDDDSDYYDDDDVDEQ